MSLTFTELGNTSVAGRAEDISVQDTNEEQRVRVQESVSKRSEGVRLYWYKVRR